MFPYHCRICGQLKVSGAKLQCRGCGAAWCEECHAKSVKATDRCPACGKTPKEVLLENNPPRTRGNP